jgi:hypothetical protein
VLLFELLFDLVVEYLIDIDLRAAVGTFYCGIAHSSFS